MGKNNELMKTQLARSESYLDKARTGTAKSAISADNFGPVKL